MKNKIVKFLLFLSVSLNGYAQTELLDVDYSGNCNNYSGLEYGKDLAQSFTSGLTGPLAKIKVGVSVSECAYTLRYEGRAEIYAGEGCSGALLGNSRFSWPSNTSLTFRELYFTGVELIAGQKYTLRLINDVETVCGTDYHGMPNKLYSSWYGCGEIYDGGIGFYFNCNPGNFDHYIQTYVYDCHYTKPSIASLTLNSKSGEDLEVSATYIDKDVPFQWQSNVANSGWVNLPENDTYSGVDSKTLLINKLKVNNHLQQLRIIANTGVCRDTSDVVTINIADTCIVVVYDTTYISVTDTLFINIETVSDVTDLQNKMAIKIYPNPASTYLNIDFINTENSNYSLKIINSLGNELFTTSIDTENSTIDISSWGGKGIYFIHIIDEADNITDIRKIVLQ